MLWVLLAGCLQEGPAPSGRHLYHSQNLASPGFLRVGDEDMIRFVERTSLATTTRGGVSDLWLTSYDGRWPRRVVANMSDYWPEQGPFNAGDRYFMVDERLVASTGGLARVATLLRLGPTFEEEYRIDGIWQYVRFTVPIAVLLGEPVGDRTCPGFASLKDNCPQLLYERPALPGRSFPTLYLWDGQDEIPIGADSGSLQLQVMGSGNTYFIFESERTLTRLVRPQNTLQLLRPNVSRFLMSGDERYAAIATTEDGKPKTVILELETGKEIQLARPNPSGWNGFGSTTFYYSQNATATDPAEIHTLDLLTGDDTPVKLPSPLVNLVASIERPNSEERLLLDSSLHGVFAGWGRSTPPASPPTASTSCTSAPPRRPSTIRNPRGPSCSKPPSYRLPRPPWCRRPGCWWGRRTARATSSPTAMRARSSCFGLTWAAPAPTSTSRIMPATAVSRPTCA
jgi:hypothetical protein